MKFLVKKTLMIDDKEIKEGSLIDESQVPKKSKKWLLDEWYPHLIRLG